MENRKYNYLYNKHINHVNHKQCYGWHQFCKNIMPGILQFVLVHKAAAQLVEIKDIPLWSVEGSQILPAHVVSLNTCWGGSWAIHYLKQTWVNTFSKSSFYLHKWEMSVLSSSYQLQAKRIKNPESLVLILTFPFIRERLSSLWIH